MPIAKRERCLWAWLGVLFACAALLLFVDVSRRPAGLLWSLSFANGVVIEMDPAEIQPPSQSIILSGDVTSYDVACWGWPVFSLSIARVDLFVAEHKTQVAGSSDIFVAIESWLSLTDRDRREAVLDAVQSSSGVAISGNPFGVALLSAHFMVLLAIACALLKRSLVARPEGGDEDRVCPQCGYCLAGLPRRRGNGDFKCPECGGDCTGFHRMVSHP
jgi:hypothetical protein